MVKSLRKRNTPTFQDGFYRCVCDPTFLMHLRQNSDFREVARYPGNGQINPLMSGYAAQRCSCTWVKASAKPLSWLASRLCQRASSLKACDSSNPPTCLLRLRMQPSHGTTADYNAAVGIFFGPQAVGVGIGGNNAQVLLNNNDDFSRFIMMIWSLYAGFELLNADFVTVGYSFDA